MAGYLGAFCAEQRCLEQLSAAAVVRNLRGHLHSCVQQREVWADLWAGCFSRNEHVMFNFKVMNIERFQLPCGDTHVTPLSIRGEEDFATGSFLGLQMEL